MNDEDKIKEISEFGEDFMSGKLLIADPNFDGNLRESMKILLHTIAAMIIKARSVH